MAGQKSNLSESSERTTCSKMNQCDRIIRHLRDYGSITSATAMSEYGIYRLASRVSDLKKQGYNITKETVTGKNRYGEATHFALYRLEERI